MAMAIAALILEGAVEGALDPAVSGGVGRADGQCGVEDAVNGQEGGALLLHMPLLGLLGGVGGGPLALPLASRLEGDENSLRFGEDEKSMMDGEDGLGAGFDFLRDNPRSPFRLDGRPGSGSRGRLKQDLTGSCLISGSVAELLRGLEEGWGDRVCLLVVHLSGARANDRQAGPVNYTCRWEHTSGDRSFPIG